MKLGFGKNKTKKQKTLSKTCRFFGPKFNKIVNKHLTSEKCRKCQWQEILNYLVNLTFF
jgi:hypothetical protein